MVVDVHRWCLQCVDELEIELAGEGHGVTQHLARQLDVVLCVDLVQLRVVHLHLGLRHVEACRQTQAHPTFGLLQVLLVLLHRVGGNLGQALRCQHVVVGLFHIERGAGVLRRRIGFEGALRRLGCADVVQVLPEVEQHLRQRHSGAEEIGSLRGVIDDYPGSNGGAAIAPVGVVEAKNVGQIAGGRLPDALIPSIHRRRSGAECGLLLQGNGDAVGQRLSLFRRGGTEGEQQQEQDQVYSTTPHGLPVSNRTRVLLSHA
jgi:hypothetical protein